MDKSPAFFVKTSVVDRNIASLKALLHLVRIHEHAQQFARIDLNALDADMREMLLASDKSLRHRDRYGFCPLYDNDVATLLVIAGVNVYSRDRFISVLKNDIKSYQALDIK